MTIVGSSFPFRNKETAAVCPCVPRVKLLSADGRETRPSSLDYGDCIWPCFMLSYKFLMVVLDPDIAIDVFTGHLYLIIIPKSLLAGAGETSQ